MSVDFSKETKLLTKTRKPKKASKERLCQVSFLISEFEVGTLAADLSSRVSDFQMRWVEDIPYHLNKPRIDGKRKSGTDKLIKWIGKAGKDGLATEVGRKLYEKAGFKPGAYYAAIARLSKLGRVKRSKGKAFLIEGKK